MKRYVTLLCVLSLIYTGCKASDGNAARPPQTVDPVYGIRIAWDYSSARQLDERGGYVRMLRMHDGSLITHYENYTGDCVMRRSYDNGETWSAPEVTFAGFDVTTEEGRTAYINMSNAEIVQLANGDILLACNYRPRTPEVAPFSIAIKRSTDNGATWSEPQVLYNAAPRFHDGCWEPSFLELPDGTLQVYFANENPYQESDEQEISVLTSHDHGATWEEDARMVSFSRGRRDGMPVGRIIGDEIVVVIEDDTKDRFKPSIVRTKISDNWSTPVHEGSPMREYCLKDPVDGNIYMGAPYLLVLPGGETMISYQTDGGRGDNWELSAMETAIGDKTARNFDRVTRPMEIPLANEAKWNSLAMWDDTTVVALLSTDYRSQHVSPWMIKGYIIPELRAATGQVKAYPVFIGRNGNANLRAGVAYNNGVLQVAGLLSYGVEKVDIMVDTGNFSLDAPGEGLYKLSVSADGTTELFEGRDGKWAASRAGVASAAVAENNLTAGFDIPAGTGAVRLNIALTAKQNGVTYTETVSATEADKSYTWLRVDL